jgi:hypothetical protein
LVWFVDTFDDFVQMGSIMCHACLDSFQLVRQLHVLRARKDMDVPKHNLICMSPAVQALIQLDNKYRAQFVLQGMNFYFDDFFTLEICMPLDYQLGANSMLAR